MKPWWTTVIAITVVTATHSARADVAPSSPEACAERAHGDRCFDAFGRPGRCVAVKFSAGRCSLTEDSAAPPTASTPPTTASAEPQTERQSTAPSVGCSATPEPLPGSGASVLFALMLLASRRRRIARHT